MRAGIDCIPSMRVGIDFVPSMRAGIDYVPSMGGCDRLYTINGDCVPSIGVG